MHIIAILFLSISSFFHELHLSITDIYYNEEAQRIEMQQRIFIDDLQEAIQKFSHDPSIDLLNFDKNKPIDSLLTAYLNSRNTFILNDQDLSFKLLEYENNMEAFTFYLFIPNIPTFDKLKFQSSVLFELFDDQTNVVSINANGKKKSDRFRNGSKPLEIDYR